MSIKTFFRPGGIRAVVCPACGQTADVMSWEDDTRWRYRTHRDARGKVCLMSRELIATDEGERKDGTP